MSYSNHSHALKTQIMGIINITPDSFYDKSRCSLDSAIKKAKKMVQDGVDIIDIGGESSRPFAKEVNEKDEIERTIPFIKEISKFNKRISIDTVKPKVAALAMENGASLINDISGFDNLEMIDIAKSYKAYMCIMHMQKDPQTMQINPKYEKGVTYELLKWFEKKIETLLKQKIDAKKIILDPGIGFGKTVNDNVEIIKNIDQFKKLGFKLLVGISRKSFMGKILNKNPKDLLEATLYVNSLLLKSNVDIIRVHDVNEHLDLIKLHETFN